MYGLCNYFKHSIDPHDVKAKLSNLRLEYGIPYLKRVTEKMVHIRPNIPLIRVKKMFGERDVLWTNNGITTSL